METAHLALHLAQCLAGTFDNYEQAVADPVWFVQLQLWHYPLPHRLEGYLAFFAEQANLLKLDQPYRQRVFTLAAAPEQRIQVQYYAFKNPDVFRGSGANPTQLSHITLEDLVKLPGCQLEVQYQGERFVAQPAPHTTCCFQYAGQTRHVILGFESWREGFASYERH